MKLSTKSRYAVMAMAELADRNAQNPDVPVSLVLISEAQSLPIAYLEQLFNKLKKNELVVSHRGANGGYTLAKPTMQITIHDIVSAVGRQLKSTRCTGASTGCQPHGVKCMTHDLWNGLDQAVAGFLNQVTLHDLLKRHVRDIHILYHKNKPLSDIAEGV